MEKAFPFWNKRPDKEACTDAAADPMPPNS